MAKPSDVVLVIEGGGSRGRAAIVREGRITARFLPAGLNPNDIGRDLLKQRLEALILPLLEQRSVASPRPTDAGSPRPTDRRSAATPVAASIRKPQTARIQSLHVLAALAGAGRPQAALKCARTLRGLLEPQCSRLRLRVTSDAEALLERFFAKRDGIVLIAGTGSVCLGVRRAAGSKKVARAGGWGSYLDKGCGFSLGLGVLDAALRAMDHRGPRTPAVELLCVRYGIKLNQVPDRFLPVRRGEVAELARVALEAAAEGDLDARRLVRQAISELADMVRVVAARLGLVGPFDVALSGGLFENSRFSKWFRRKLDRRMASACVIQVAEPLACLLTGHTYS